MRLVQLTVPSATFLLSATAALAQQGTSGLQNVYVDVEGTAVQVPIALAVEACNLDEAGVQQAAQSRAETTGLDTAAVEQLMAASAAGSLVNAPSTTTGAGTTVMDGPAAADAGSVSGAATPSASSGTMGETSGAGGSVTANAPGTVAPASEPAPTGSTALEAANTPAPGGEPVSPDEIGTSETGSTGDMTGLLEGAETTSADNLAVPDGNTTAAQALDSDADAQRLALAVCQIDLARAGELGLSGVRDVNSANLDAGTDSTD